MMGEYYWGKAPVQIVLMIIAGLFETVSVSLILPFMDIVEKPEKSMKKWYIRMICDLFNVNTAQSMIIILALGLAILYVIKNAFIIFEINIQQEYVSDVMYFIKSNLMERLLQKPYEYYIKLNTGKILTIMNGHMINITDMLGRFLSMLGEFVTSVMLIVMLFIVTPKISLLMGVLLGFILLMVLKVIRPILKRASNNNQAASDAMYKWVMQAIEGIKEVKILNSESFFLKNYKKSGRIFADTTCKYMVLSNTPRSFIETAVMSSFFIVVAIFIAVGNNLSNMIPVISMIAMAAVRLLPAANRISTAMGSIVFTEPFIDDVIELADNLEKTKDMNPASIIPKPMSEKTEFDRISVKDVTYHYPDTDSNVLESVSLDIQKGDSIGIVGSSGAGKTTVMDVMLGLLVPQFGDILYDNKKILENYSEWISLVGYIPQRIFVTDDTIRANVAFGIEDDEIDDKRVWRALRDAALEEFVKGLPDGINTPIGERGMRLSGGQIQRIGIARALYRKPQILFLDEATSALDNDTEEAIIDSITRLKGQVTLIIIAHRLTTIESCDHVFRIEDGKAVPER